MKHWVFILILSMLLSGKPTPVSQGQTINDSIQKIPLSKVIASKEKEREGLFDSLKTGNEDIVMQITNIKKKPIPKVSKEPKVVIKHEVKYVYIHDTVYVMQVPSDNGTTPKIIYMSIDQKPAVIAELKKPTFFQRLFHRKNKNLRKNGTNYR